jgi:hypothetical protein
MIPVDTIVCSNCGADVNGHDNYIKVVSPKVRIRNMGETLVWENEGEFIFCSISCFNTYLMRIAGDDNE